MEHELVARGYIPPDKSWMNRVGVLDIQHGYDDITKFLGSQDKLSDDLEALYRASIDWKSSDTVYVGESATLYRFLKFASWKLGKNKKFILDGSLKKRKICNNPEIVSYSLEELLKLDYGTSQWASASVLLGNEEKIENPPYKLKLTYEAVSHWKKQRKNRQCWEPRYDETILRQAVAYLELFKYGRTSFVPLHSEDYCFARAFGLINKEEGERLWSSLKGHESNRIEEMERALKDYENGREVDSRDHRVVQAVVMKSKLEGRDVKIKYTEAVNKSWPEFWKFMNDSLYLRQIIV